VKKISVNRREKKKYIPRRWAQKKICVNQRERNQRRSARKDQKNSSRRCSQIESADGRRAEKKRVLLFMIFVEG